MSKKIFISTVVVALVLGSIIGYIRGLPDDFVDESAVESATSDFGFRCGDGSEFTILPSADLRTIVIVPATSADYVKQTTLRMVRNNSYAAEGITLLVDGASAELTTASTSPTTCTAMNPAAATELFNTEK